MSCKLSTKLPSITVQMSQEEYDMIYRFAHRSGASVSQVVRLGTLRIINQIEKGEYIPEVLSEYRNGMRPGHA